MPILVDRRSFLQQTLGAAAFFAGVSQFAFAEARSQMHWALLSDTHIAQDPGDTYRGFHPLQNLKRTLAAVPAGAFDTLLVNGDLARLEGHPGDYGRLTSYLDPVTETMPLLATLGNHDDRKNARAALARLGGEIQPVERKLVTTLDAGALNFVLLDSLLATNIAAGQLGKSQRDWLAGFLDANAAKPVVIFVHHNPDPDDDNGLVDATRLLAMAQRHPAVKAVLFGHTHVWRYQKQDGLHLVNLPAVGYNFRDGEPVGWTEATFSGKGAQLKLHAIAGNTAKDGETLDLVWR